MTALVTKHLPLVAGAPDGIKKLRQLILALAIQGRLLPQDPADEPAKSLLARITTNRKLQKGIRATKGIAAATCHDLGFSIPEGWVPVRLGELGDWGAGATPSRSNHAYYGGTTPWFKSGELTSDLIDSAEESVTELALKECSLRLNSPGDVLIAMYGATIGKTAILAVPATTNQAVCACTPFEGVYNRFLLVALKALKPNFVGQGAGGAQPNISKEKIVSTAIGLPPEQEQHRIVAKVDELMALCDKLEADQGSAEIAHAQLVQALLESLTQAKDAEDFQESWRRLSENFHTLFTTEASIDFLKQSVLQLGVMGKLASQNADDEKADVFLDCIDAIRAGLVQSQRKSTVEVAAEPLFGAPANWVWRSLGSVLNITGGVTLGRKLGDRAMVSKPYLRVANVQRGYLALEQIKETSVPSDEVEKYRLHEHDLLITEGGDWDKVGRTAIWRGEIPDCLHQNHVFRARPLVSDFCTEWAELFLNSAFARQYFAGSAKQTTNLASINMTQLRACPFPVPPLAEQHRIIAKVGELMSLFDQLYAHLIEARQKHSQLAAVLVEEAVA